MKADEILRKHEDANEMHFHEVDREWIIEAMEEFAALRQPAVIGRSEQLVAFLKWVGDGYDFENNAKKIVKEYIDEGN